MNCWLAALWADFKDMFIVTLIYGGLIALAIWAFLTIASWLVLQLKQSLGF
ncbi:hypothetical protein M736_06595 [Neisseria gonorrhoeae MIA_2011_03-10]|nr:hypothetical protein M680_00805 [Neisseria gonorrhoeae SK8976]KLR82077.1 hypothetical protein M684_00735 [Neisseria gonorrhoeae SK15454]KLR96871.1 hypothetical protein M674_02160 [Neisseria gonorrhoeae SK708]KLS49744.1 hypothetical protein M736_06595 [Neisseria gonorrhoeae MIA_2011_03-10]KLS56507.1 hypothetical protein M732_01990 [Neisseria gonorrhoeae ATL_2011_05-08]KLT06344.1 hypothetical protein M782_08650 [Neisseria gonorrhoeae MU_NG17]